MCVIMATVLAPSHLNVFIFILFGFGNMVHAYTVKAPRRWVREGRRSGLRASIRNKRDECESSLAGGNVSFTSYLAPLLFFFQVNTTAYVLYHIGASSKKRMVHSETKRNRRNFGLD